MAGIGKLPDPCDCSTVEADQDGTTLISVQDEMAVQDETAVEAVQDESTVQVETTVIEAVQDETSLNVPGEMAIENGTAVKKEMTVEDEITIDYKINYRACWELQEILDYWKNPQKRKFIVNAIPIDDFASGTKDKIKILEKDIKKLLEKDSSSFDKTLQPKDIIQPVLNRLIKRPFSLLDKSAAAAAKEVLTSTTACRYPISGLTKISMPEEIRMHTTSLIGESNEELEGVSTDIEEISETDLKNFPYNSIGRIFWVNPNEDDECVRSGTGFYIGDGTVISVAHNFKHQEESVNQTIAGRTPVFVPAMVDENDIDGKNYGRYILDDVCIDHMYLNHYLDKPFPSQYDICIAKVVLECTKPLPDPFLQLTDSSRIQAGTFDIIGYTQSVGKMVKFSGTFEKQYTANNVVVITPAAYLGMSGGPWINDKQEVVGIQSAISSHCSYSPILSRDILTVVDIMKMIYNDTQ